MKSDKLKPTSYRQKTHADKKLRRSRKENRRETVREGVCGKNYSTHRKDAGVRAAFREQHSVKKIVNGRIHSRAPALVPNK